MEFHPKLLMKAVLKRRLKLIRILVDGGSDVNAPDFYGRTALMAALYSEYRDDECSDVISIVMCLLKNGANCNAVDNDGKTTLMYACNCNQPVSVVQLLLDSGADPYIKDNEGRSALSYAANIQVPAVLLLLAEHCKVFGDGVITKLLHSMSVINGRETCVPSLSVPQASGVTGQKYGISGSTYLMNCGKKSSDNVLLAAVDNRQIRQRTRSNSPTDYACAPQIPTSLSYPKQTLEQTKISINSGILSKNNRILRRRETADVLLPVADNANESIIQCSYKTSIRPHGPVMNKNKLISCKPNMGRRCSAPQNSYTWHDVCASKKAVVDPGGRLLRRSGSATQLFDEVSTYRPGTLPSLNINMNPPIPSMMISGNRKIVSESVYMTHACPVEPYSCEKSEDDQWGHTRESGI